MITGEDAAKLFAWAQANDLALFPIPAWSKQPTGIVRSHATDWSKDISRWWEWYHHSGGCNFGVSCGPSRLVVVDEDAGGAEKLREWFCSRGFVPVATVITPSGGAHYYFRVPADIDSEALRQPNLCGKEVNVRAGHGYVVAPWSRTSPVIDSHVKAAGPYTLTGAPISAAPAALLEHCNPRASEPAHGPVAGEFDRDGWPLDAVAKAEAMRRVDGIVARLRTAVPGERNEKLNQACFDMGKLIREGKIEKWLAIEIVQEAGEGIGIPRDEAKAKSTIRSGMNAGAAIGYEEPQSALLQLLAAAVPLGAPTPPVARSAPYDENDLTPATPLVERLLYPGMITVLSGAPGSGKTTFLAALMAASVGDAKGYKFGDVSSSDLALTPCCWLFMSFEGGKQIKRTTAAWHVGTGVEAKYPERIRVTSIDDGFLVGGDGRNPVVNAAQVKYFDEQIQDMERRFPGMPIILVIDNIISAVQNSMDIAQANLFMHTLKSFARRGVAVAVLAHPPKSGASTVFGSIVFSALGDITGEIEVLRVDDGEWIQWVEFGKHREGANGRCLEVRSKRIDRPLVPLPDSWCADNPAARARALHDLRVPYITTLRVREKHERESVASGVVKVTSVTPKPETEVKI